MKTMTTQESLLALAQAVYPNRAFRADGVRIVYEAKTSWVSLMGPVSSITDVAFDPANNSEQAMEVLCWLMARDSCNEVCHDTIVFYPRPGRFVTPEHIAHDNTPDSLRAAIVQAACVVVSA